MGVRVRLLLSFSRSLWTLSLLLTVTTLHDASTHRCLLASLRLKPLHRGNRVLTHWGMVWLPQPVLSCSDDVTVSQWLGTTGAPTKWNRLRRLYYVCLFTPGSRLVGLVDQHSSLTKTETRTRGLVTPECFLESLNLSLTVPNSHQRWGITGT